MRRARKPQYELPQIPENAKLRFHHFRHVQYPDGTISDLLPKVLALPKAQEGENRLSPQGGAVVAALFVDGRMVGSAMSLCMPEDHFDAKLGRVIAARRAVFNYMQPIAARKRRERRKRDAQRKRLKGAAKTVGKARDSLSAGNREVGI